MFGQVQDLSGLWEFVFLPAPAEDFCMDELAFHSFAPVPGCFDLLEQYFYGAAPASIGARWKSAVGPR